MAEFARFWDFLWVRKRFWLPLVMLTLIFGGLVLLSEGPDMMPFVYRRL